MNRRDFQKTLAGSVLGAVLAPQLKLPATTGTRVRGLHGYRKSPDWRYYMTVGIQVVPKKHLLFSPNYHDYDAYYWDTRGIGVMYIYMLEYDSHEDEFTQLIADQKFWTEDNTPFIWEEKWKSIIGSAVSGDRKVLMCRYSSHRRKFIHWCIEHGYDKIIIPDLVRGRIEYKPIMEPWFPGPETREDFSICDVLNTDALYLRQAVLHSKEKGGVLKS